jgi:hypothetical protein
MLLPFAQAPLNNFYCLASMLGLLTKSAQMFLSNKRYSRMILISVRRSFHNSGKLITAEQAKCFAIKL